MNKEVSPAAAAERSYELMVRLSIVGDKNYPRDSVVQTLDIIGAQIRGDARLGDVARWRLLDRVAHWRSVMEVVE